MPGIALPRTALAGLNFGKVFTSPLQRARRTRELAGFGSVAEIDPNLVEWNYGQYEGLTSAEIRARRPDWQLFRDGCPGGESPEDVAARADAIVERDTARARDQCVDLFKRPFSPRVFAARWLALEALGGNLLCVEYR